MALHTLGFWEIVFDATQIVLCGCIIVFLILNRIRFKQLILRAPTSERPSNISTEFLVEAVRRQTELAFNHILETIDKERQTLDAYYRHPERRIDTGLFTSLATPPLDQISSPDASEPDAANVIYSEIEGLAEQGLSLADISERLNVPQGEVDLVLRLKHLRGKSVSKKDRPSV
ncbi:MAG: hypothetical protein JRF36_13710 [Deltaproteobacteria bacterium]|jgi:hypothetical protein|nr:hypothetical protein [Deltaproteobacteria bacterium]MBW2468220.1 hypothetical protein [Deltaproteobacteria bacterium]MBW2487094.1 hypothetical protein [Deltaproteobacteria bacterium]MBW2516653.1 hypothetical protein [Deltaproteobacteria bacterium]